MIKSAKGLLFIARPVAPSSAMKSFISLRPMSSVRMFAMILAVAPVGVFGVTISQTLHFALDSSSNSAPLAFTPFDPVNGDLQSVQVSFDNIVLTHDWWLWNGISPRTVSYTAQLSGADITISDGANSQSLLFSPILYSGTTGVLNRVNFAKYLTESAYFTQGTGIAPPAADYFHSGGNSPPPPGVLSGSLPLETFNPGLTISFDPGVLAAYEAGSLSVVASNVFISSKVSVAGDITVTYVTAPVTVPDGAPTWVFFVGVVALAAGRRRFGNRRA